MRVVLCGIGRFGRQHLLAWESTGRSRVEVIVDPSAAGNSIPRPGGTDRIPIVARLEDIPSDTSLDIAAVVTPVWTHVDLARRLCAKRLPFLVEKPLAPSSIEAREIRDSAERAGVIGMPGHIMRFSRPHADLQRELRERGLPPIALTLRRDRSAALLDMYPGEHPASLTGTHDIDLAIWFTRSPVVRVVARDELANGQCVGFEASLDHANGSRSIISGSYLFALDTPDRVSDEVVIEDLSNGRIARYAHESTSEQPTDTDPDNALFAEVSHFLDVVAGVIRTPIVSLDDAIHGLAVAEAIIQSSQLKGEAIQVKPLETTIP